MAAGNFTVPDLAKLNIASLTNVLAQTTYKITLHTSVWVPNNSTNEVFSHATNELGTGFGYTAGGGTLTSVALTQTAGVVKFTSAAFTWTASGGSIPAWRTALVRAIGTFNGKVDPIVGYFLGDSTPADVPATAAPGTIVVTPNASGFITYT